MAINGTVQATGEFAPTSTGDTYAIIDAKYMRDGFRNVDTLADLDNITEDRRIAGMVVGVSGGTIYYKLNQAPWLFDFTDWTVFTTGGGSVTEYWVSGSTGLSSIRTNNLSGVDATGDYAIAGGYQNTAIGNYSLTIGGAYNSVSGIRSSVIGGFNNTIVTVASESIIGGGQNNSITGGTLSVVLGGYNNVNGGTRGVIIGGGYNRVTTAYGTILGGRYNSIGGIGFYSTVIGGTYNRSSGYYSAVIGGTNNRATAQGSVVIGGASISGVSADTVYVPNLNINYTPLVDNALTQVLVRAVDGTIKTKGVNTFTFTGNTSATCIGDLYVTDIYGCSPVTIHGSTTGTSNSSFKVRNLTTELINVRDDGYTEFTKNGAQSIFGDQSSNYLTHIQNRLIQFSNSATYTGFHADRNGTGIALRATSANDISLIDSTGTMTFSTGWDDNFNTSGTLAMLIDGDNQRVGIGLPTNLTVPEAKLHVRGTGTTNTGSALLIDNSNGTDLLRITNDGLSMFNTTNPTSPFAGVVQTIHAESTVTDPTVYASTQAVTTTYFPSGPASGYIRNFSTNLIKYGTHNAPYVAANTSYVRNDSSSGTTTDVLGYDGVAFCNAAGNTTNLFAYQGNAQIQAGANVTNLGGLKLVFGVNQLGTTITNMYGVLVSTPQNTGGAVTNTYGLYLQSNTLGSSGNWGVYQAGSAVRNYYAGKSGFNITAPTALVHAKATGDTFTGVTFKVDGATVDNLLTIKDNGRIGVNATPNSGDRMFITAGSGLDGAINISSANLANNGYAILAQGGTSSSNYNGVWSDVTGGGTGIGRSFYGNSGISGYAQNYGGYFSARNGSTYSVGVYGSANGGDAVNPTDFVTGVWGNVGASEADDRRAIYGNISQATNVVNANSYGMRFDVSYISTVSAETIYGVYSDASAVGSGVTNMAGYFKATNVNNSENYAIITDGGNSGFGTLVPTDMLHVNGVTGSTQFRLEQSYTPTGSGDTAGNIGSVAWDDNYWYQKTNTGWGRIAWSYAF